MKPILLLVAIALIGAVIFQIKRPSVLTPVTVGPSVTAIVSTSPTDSTVETTGTTATTTAEVTADLDTLEKELDALEKELSAETFE